MEPAAYPLSNSNAVGCTYSLHGPNAHSITLDDALGRQQVSADSSVDFAVHTVERGYSLVGMPDPICVSYHSQSREEPRQPLGKRHSINLNNR